MSGSGSYLPETTTMPPQNSEKQSPPSLDLGLFRMVQLAVFAMVVMWGMFGYVLPTAFGLADVCAGNPACTYLQPGWIPGKFVDLADGQWRSLRANFPLLIAVAVGFCSLSFIAQRVAKTLGSVTPRIVFYVAFSTIFVSIVFGSGAVWLLLLASINFSFSKFGSAQVGSWPLSTALTWTFGCIILYTNEFYSDYYRFQYIPLVGPALGWLDSFGGLYQWTSAFNLLFLRMISFNVDYYWAATKTSPQKVSVRDEPDSYTWRVKTDLALKHYNYVNYLIYLFYVPLIIAGPTITFNAFYSQVEQPQTTFDLKYKVMYSVRWLFAAILLDVSLHYVPIFSLTYGHAYTDLSPAGISMLTYITLHFMWMKFLVLWRFFRCWAMWDDIEVVENMNRCVHNNHNFSQFWRSWHRSFNQWLIRYLFVPLGGSRVGYGRRLVNVAIVFTFVALWHEMNLKLLAWGWMISLAFIPELAILGFFASKRMAWFRKKWFYRHLAVFAATADTFLLCLANVVGFSVGLDGANDYVQKLTSPEGLWAMAATFGYLFALIQWQFFIRDIESSTSAKGGKGF